MRLICKQMPSLPAHAWLVATGPQISASSNATEARVARRWFACGLVIYRVATFRVAIIRVWSRLYAPANIPRMTANTTLRNRFGARVRELRKATTGLSQEAFADKCGFVRSYMGKIETGKANPSLDSIQTIADALGVPVKTLFEEDSAEGAPSVQD
ncbi:helix-turn-helix domain-containing protein [Burkholderia cenocepacia]|uniref:helix-turn-helix domain-containing protein n=1 Tax=Burkholderia cenocepacia TaxID=95486 RepID=UPI00286D8095|nr:helix-turn-helix transcriptional regulator [Burkholderia cenocepacia]